jgi:hypothetical protein
MNTEYPEKEQELLGVVTNDYQIATSFHLQQQQKIIEYVNSYNMRPYGNEQEHKSKMIIPVVRKYIDYQIPGIKAPFLDTVKIVTAQATNGSASGLALMSERYINQIYRKQFKAEPFIDKLARTLLLQGTAIVRTDWDYRENNRFTAIKEKRVVKAKSDDFSNKIKLTTEQKTQIKKHRKSRINRPTSQVLLHEEVFIAPNIDGDISNADYVIHQYKSNLSSLREAGVYSNLDQVKPSILSTSSDTLKSYYGNNVDVVPSQVHLNFSDEARQPVDIKEYWGYYDIDGDDILEPIVCTIANDSVVIRLELNPFPDGKLPFLMVNINKGLYSIYGDSDAYFLQVVQKQSSTIWRGGFDNLAKANNGQRGYPLDFFPNSNERKNKDLGKDYIYNPQSRGQIISDQYNELPGVFYNTLDKLEAEAGYFTGVTPQGLNSLGNPSMGTPTSGMSAAQLRQLDIVRSVALNVMIPMFRKWLIYAYEFLSPEEWANIVGKENVVPVPQDSEYDNIVDFDMEITTQELTQMKLDKLAFLFQTLGPVSPPEIQLRQQAKILDLAQLHDEADFLRNYQPEPDPMEEQYKQLELQRMQLENAKVQEDIKYRQAEQLYKQSQAEENKADIKKKFGEAAYKESLSNIQKVKLINELQNKPDQYNFSKHLSSLASREKIEQDRARLKAYDIDSKKQVKLKELELRSFNEEFNRKKFDKDLTFKYDNMLQLAKSKSDSKLDKAKTNFDYKDIFSVEYEG